jgi:hypothetical protein
MRATLNRPSWVHPPSAIFGLRASQTMSPGCTPPGIEGSSDRPSGSVTTESLVHEYWFSGVMRTKSIWKLG